MDDAVDHRRRDSLVAGSQPNPLIGAYRMQDTNSAYGAKKLTTRRAVGSLKFDAREHDLTSHVNGAATANWVRTC